MPAGGCDGGRGEATSMEALALTRLQPLAGIAVGLLALLVFGWLGRAARRVMATAPEGMPRREEMLRGARTLPVILFVACALPAAIGVALLGGGSEAAVWLVALGVAGLGALMIAQRFIYWQFAGLGMATPEAIERAPSGEVDWDAAMALARMRERGWVSRLLLPIAGIIVIVGAIALPAILLRPERELRFAEWLWTVDDEIELATTPLGKPQVWTDIGFEPKRSARDYKRPSDGGRVKLSYFAAETTDEQVRAAIAETEQILARNRARGIWRITAIPPDGDAIEVLWPPNGG